jgi:hypothetical protein
MAFRSGRAAANCLQRTVPPCFLIKTILKPAWRSGLRRWVRLSVRESLDVRSGRGGPEMRAVTAADLGAVTCPFCAGLL